MKKFLITLVTGILWCNVGFAEDHYQSFMTECDLSIKKVKEMGFKLTHVSTEEDNVHLFFEKGNDIYQFRKFYGHDGYFCYNLTKN